MEPEKGDGDDLEPKSSGRGKAAGSRRTQFGSPDRPPPKPAEPKPPPSEEIEDALTVMRHVANRPPSADTTYQQKEYRKWMAKNRATFMARLMDMEKGREPPGEPGGSPEPEEPVEGLIQDLISRALEGV